ncbi:MAG TPA: DUF1800 family protein [Pyrinomonadaceae bacterium]|jgi:uncharacterized protein (DUF1800 family)
MNHQKHSERPFGQNFLRFFIFCLFLFAAASASAQDSPAPVLISENDSTRALSSEYRRLGYALPRRNTRIFYPGDESRIVLYAYNLAPEVGESADSLRVFAEDRDGRIYKFPVESVERLAFHHWIYAIVVRLYDESGLVGQPKADGDVLVRLTWRGNTSNRVRLGLGAIGGAIADDENSTPTPAPTTVPTENLASAFQMSEGDRYRFMEQATFGANPAVELRLRQLGAARWMTEQAEKPYPSIPYPNLPQKSSNKTVGCPSSLPADQHFRCELDHYSPYMLQRWYFTDALYGDAQLRRRAAWALSKIWVVAANQMEQARWHLEYLKILDRHAFGNYRELMQDMTLNPAMGNYLDMMQSTRQSPNENYPREILQLFSIGLDELNPNGTPKLANGKRIPTYTQNDLVEYTKVFTGWTTCNSAPPACPNALPGIPNYVDPMTLTIGVATPTAANPGNHDISAKTLLSYPGAPFSRIPACANCTDGVGDAEDIKNYARDSLGKTLDNIYNHPNVAPFVSRRLIQHLVTGDPSPAYVARVAAVFNDNRANPRQMLEVFKAILLDPEARGSRKTAPEYGKMREPFQLATSFLRAFGVKSASAAAGCQNRSDGFISPQIVPMGQEVLSPPSVFSYYSPEYVLPGTSIVAPEFNIFDTETTFHRSNFIHLMTYAYIFPQDGAWAVVPCGTALNLAQAQNWASLDPTGIVLIENLNRLLMHGSMSAEMKADVREAVTAIHASDALARAKQAIYLIGTSAQYQVQR